MTVSAPVLSRESRFTIRLAQPSDVAEIAALDRHMWGDLANPFTTYRQLLDFFPETVLLGQTDDGFYAGCAVGLLRSKPLSGWVLSIDIAEQFRGQGLGRLLVTELVQQFGKLGVREISTVIAPTNSASKRLFKALSFSCHSLERDYFGPSKDMERWVRTLR